MGKIILIDDDYLFKDSLYEVLLARMNYYNINCMDICKNFDFENLKLADVDCIFLDVEIKKYNGIELAKKIREKDDEIDIIFISNHRHYVFNSFQVRPFTYILKDELLENGIEEIDRYFIYWKKREEKIKLKYNNSIIEIKKMDIINISKYKTKIIVTTVNNKIEVIMNLSDMYIQLDKYFVYINKSEIINLIKVNNIDRDIVIMNNGEKYYISRRRIKEVTKMYFKIMKEYNK